jgi:hypothetical protein
MFSDLSPQSGRAKGICSTNLAILPKKKYLKHGGKTRETHAPLSGAFIFILRAAAYIVYNGTML